MMVVRIEIWPGGDEQAAFEIGRMDVANVGTVADVGAYAASVTQRATPTIGVPSFVRSVTVASHPRGDGPWALVARVLGEAAPAPLNNPKSSTDG
ncbi:hypothetical protein DAH51_26190 [Sphingobium yanoikuyae]|jgi:hypothetical protein|uniref:Uncharacterized protein n=1 Tax=Sphingobium yanoikuyae TaxID=13690 RepID=A0A430BCC1_SPHYA|nr:MAG: hypothetical protein COC10_00450 [Sphingobium sp.]RSU46191.1 hypothetical protein DAH51_26190 [Sphingobium yanoikuyae]